MKNLHVLPTDKPSRLFKSFGKLNIGDYITKRENLQVTNQHLYITNDEEIIEGDLIIYKNGDEYFFAEYRLGYYDRYELCKKIILTTDPQLIANGIQEIDDEFLQWYVKNPSCEEVEVGTYAKKIRAEFDANGYREMDVFGKDYRITIPQEEPKQETLEEAAENESEYLADYEDKEAYQKAFIEGAKWQAERSYSEEEVNEFIKLKSK